MIKYYVFCGKRYDERQRLKEEMLRKLGFKFIKFGDFPYLQLKVCSISDYGPYAVSMRLRFHANMLKCSRYGYLVNINELLRFLDQIQQVEEKKETYFSLKGTGPMKLNLEGYRISEREVRVKASIKGNIWSSEVAIPCYGDKICQVK